MTLEDKQEKLVEDLALIRDGQERFAYIVNRGRRQPKIGPEKKIDQYKVEGCLSNIWLIPEARDGKCYFAVDSDSMIVKGIAGILCEFYSGHAPEEILKVEPDFLAKLGVTQHLSENRRNGLSHVWRTIRGFAASARGMTGTAHEVL